MSSVTIEFLIDFEIDYSLTIGAEINDVIQPDKTWTWVATRSAAYEVTEGTPTGNAGETTATNFESAFLLDNPSGYTTVRTVNSLVITSTTTGEIFNGVKGSDGSQFLVKGVAFNITFNNTETPIDNSNIDLALVRSPHYINVPFNFSTTTGINAEVFIWDGDLTTVPSTPIYEITKSRPTTDFNEFNINVSKIVRDNLEPSINIDLTSTPKIVDSTDDSVKWVKYVVNYIDAEETQPEISFTISSVDGYGEYLEGVNPTPSLDWLSDCNIRKVSRDGIIVLPFLNRGNITTFDVVSNGSDVNQTITPTATNESTDFIQYLLVDVASDVPNDTVLSVSDGTTTFLFYIEDECRYTPKQVVFKNKQGVFESLTLFKKSKESLSVQKSQFVNNYLTNGVYDTTRHQIKDINITAKQSIKCNTGFLNEQQNVLFEQMLVSDQVYFYENNQLVPIRPTTSSLEFKTRINDGLINYELDLEYAFNYIQNV